MGKKTDIDWADSTYYAIPEYEGYYASKEGNILSLKKGKNPKLLKQITAHAGHRYVFLYKDNKMKKVWVHRAVRSAIDGEDRKNLICRHLDDNPSNNNIENLAWGTIQDNADDKKRNKGYEHGELKYSAKLTDEKVMEIRKRYSKGESARILSTEYGVAHTTIITIVKGNKWKHIPIVPVEVQHSSRRLTPLSEEEKTRFVNEGKKHASSIRKSRELIPCACGCGTMIPMHDAKGRPKKYVRGHNQIGKHWKWSERDGKND